MLAGIEIIKFYYLEESYNQEQLLHMHFPKRKREYYKL